jgi:hypothetical protein
VELKDGRIIPKPSPGLYEIRVAGALDHSWCDLLEDMELSIVYEGPQPVTVIRVVVPDQAALAGLLEWVFGLNMTLLSVRVLNWSTEGEDHEPAHDDLE